MPLAGHVIVWVTAVALMGLAAPLVRAYADYLERRTRARTDEVMASVLETARQEREQASSEASST